MFGGLGKLLKGDPTEATRRKYQPTVDIINGFEPQMEVLTDEALRAKTAELKGRVQAGESLDDILPEAFAVVREASRRVLGLRPFDVQLMGGILLHEGQIAEMRTGEGKTLVAVLPAFLNALSGSGVHVVTVNDYLARRDSEYVGQVHRFLGLKVGLIQASMKPEERSAAYSCDVTYVTNSELGFDYLRDNLAQTKNDLVLSEFNFCIIDEVDSILIDEARTPLIISGPADKPSEKYIKASQIADAMGRDVHYTIDEKQRSALLTEDGYEAAEDILQVVDLYDPREQWAAYLINAIKAKELFQKDVNYIIRNDEIIIVDEFTGRTMPGRRWSEGLHQAVEAKEGVTIQKESVTLASISYQNFFRTFPKLSGMTGTAATEASEFANIYDLQVAVVPTNKPVDRADNTDVVFRNLGAKWGAVVQEIVRVHKKGRPMLVGTTSVENSELLSSLLVEAGIKHQVLNAKPENVERESEIVAQTGRKGAVTLATNMAGRGTDIVLGGNPSFMARLKMREMLMPLVVAAVDEDGKPVKAKWKVSTELFPCELSEDTAQRAKQAVELAESAWGSKALPVLEAEDRLSVACEKAPTSDPVTAALREAYVAMEGEYEAVTAQEKEEVKGLGGLYVIGTERHESRRIDNQLRGRCGRQGDPGATRYFLSLEDNLFRIFGGDRIQSMMNAFNVGDLPIESGMLTDALDNAQKKVESYFFDIRKQLFDYDQVLNTQRDRIYAQRRKALVADDLNPIMVEFAEKTMDDILEANIPASTPLEEWPQKVPVLVNKIKQYCPLLEALQPELVMEVSGAGSDYEAMRGYLRKQAVDAYKEKYQFVEDFEKGLMQDAQRFFLLTQTDNLWKEHLQAINFLRQAVGLRGYGQRDPLTEYKLEGFNLFVETMAQIRRNVVYNVYIFQPVRLQRKDGEEGDPTQQQQQQQTQSTAA